MARRVLGLLHGDQAMLCKQIRRSEAVAGVVSGGADLLEESQPLPKLEKKADRGGDRRWNGALMLQRERGEEERPEGGP